MLKKIFALTLAGSMLAIAGSASAEPWDRPGVEHRERDRDFERRDRDEHRDRDFVRDRRERDAVRHMWVRGERFAFEPGFYVVADWRGARLPPPAFGFHWVHVRGNFLLVNNRTGVVADVLFDRF